jgi:pyruvate ferredoxin oxidoreductase beta subunit
MATLKELVKRPERMAGGHRACTGCGAMIATRQILLSAGDAPVVCGAATGCLEVVTTIFPYTAWETPFIHNAFENVAATISGAEAAYESLKKKGRIPDRKINFIAFGGDGGTYDIGLQSLSGAMERGHRMLYVCYNNEAYMNTGVQRSSATPHGAHTTTSPSGKVSYGKTQYRKDLTEILVAHDIPYVATVIPSHWLDLSKKVEKALAVDGPSFINVLSPCQLGWAYPPETTIESCRLAVDTCFWPLYEVENGYYKITVKPREKKPIIEYLKTQGRFRHLNLPANEHAIREMQEYLDMKWEKLVRRAEADQALLKERASAMPS